LRIPLKAFAGMQPRLEGHLLPDNAAADAIDVVLDRGSIEPLKAPSLVTSLAKVGPIRSIYRFGKDIDDDTVHWFHWAADADVTRGPIPDDTMERTYFTVAGQPPMVTDASIATADGLMPTAAYRLGIPAPETQAIVSTTEQQDPGDLVAQSCILAYTYVSGWGEEGPPSAVSMPFDVKTGDTVNVSNLDGPPSGAYNITHKRLYVSVTDAAGVAVLRFWKEIAVGSGTYGGVLSLSELGEALPDISPIPPPEDLFGIMSHPGGFLIGFSGQRVYRSEPLKPYAWPHFSPVSYDIVGGAVMGQAVVICTTGDTYMATQADPISFTPIRLDGSQPCVAKRTIKAFKGGVLYASPDGLVLVDPNGNLSVVTGDLLARDQWQAYKPESMHAAVHDNRYFCWYDTGDDDAGCLVLEVDLGRKVLTRSTQYVTAAYSDLRRDELFVALSDDKVYKWNVGSPLQGEWTSKTFIAERAQNIGAVQIIAEAYPVSFVLEAIIQTDSGARAVTTTKSVTNGRPVRLTGSYRARQYRYTVKASSTVREVTIASVLANITAQ